MRVLFFFLKSNSHLALLNLVLLYDPGILYTPLNLALNPLYYSFLLICLSLALGLQTEKIDAELAELMKSTIFYWFLVCGRHSSSYWGYSKEHKWRKNSRLSF